MSGVTPTEPKLRYWVEGNTGTRVLLIMGFGMPGEIWRPQIDHLKQNHRVAYYDARGIGQSDPGRAMSMRTHAHDALRVLDALGWERAHLVGVSMGGMVAQELALADETRFKSLGLIATHPGGVRSWFPTGKGLRLFARVNTSPPEARLRYLRQLLYPESFLEGDEHVVDGRMQEMAAMRAPVPTMAAQLLSVLRHNTARRLPSLKLPTLVLQPEQDLLVRPHHSERLADLIAHAELRSFPDAGHGLIHQCAELVAEHLMEHFRHSESLLGLGPPPRETPEPLV